jgi:hypothetical protein
VEAGRGMLSYFFLAWLETGCENCCVRGGGLESAMIYEAFWQWPLAVMRFDDVSLRMVELSSPTRKTLVQEQLAGEARSRHKLRMPRSHRLSLTAAHLDFFFFPAVTSR